VTPGQARQLFKRELAVFSRTFPRMKSTRFVLLDQSCTGPGHCRFRDLAYAEPRIPQVTMLCRTLLLPTENVRGLILHELGHVADVHHDRAGREQRADDIAEWVTGTRISYDRHSIQTTAPARYPRPRNLHR
jgi:hypothetical protein